MEIARNTAITVNTLPLWPYHSLRLGLELWFVACSSTYRKGKVKGEDNERGTRQFSTGDGRRPAMDGAGRGCLGSTVLGGRRDGLERFEPCARRRAGTGRTIYSIQGPPAEPGSTHAASRERRANQCSDAGRTEPGR